MSERHLESKSSRELHGDFAGSYGEVRGINRFFKVASSIGHVEERVRNKGLKILDIPSIKEQSELYVIYEDGQTFGESLGVWNIDGVWVCEQDLERYEKLIGVEGYNINDR